MASRNSHSDGKSAKESVVAIIPTPSPNSNCLYPVKGKKWKEHEKFWWVGLEVTHISFIHFLSTLQNMAIHSSHCHLNVPLQWGLAASFTRSVIFLWILNLDSTIGFFFFLIKGHTQNPDKWLNFRIYCLLMHLETPVSTTVWSPRQSVRWWESDGSEFSIASAIPKQINMLNNLQK